MITLVRLEADAKTLADLISDLDAAQKSLKLPKDYHVHDEHYERVHDTCFKGRRVFKPGVKGATTQPPYVLTSGSASATGPTGYTVINAK